MALVRIAVGLLLLSGVAAAAKCVQFTSKWSVASASNKTACLTLSGGQWIGGAKQEKVGASAPSRKTWWTKRMVPPTATQGMPASERIHFGGQPTIRDLKMLYEQGFTAVYSLWSFPTARDAASGAIESAGKMPRGSEAKAAAADIGLLYKLIPDAPNGTSASAFWHSAAAVDDITAFMDFALQETSGAIYLHCYIGRTASAAVQLWRLRKGYVEIKSAKTKSAQAMLEASYHGFDLSNWKASLEREAGDSVGSLVVDNAHFALGKYHWLKYLGRHGNVQIFDAGQIHKEHIAAIKAANITVVVNMRKGLEGREEVNLLNIGKAPSQSSGCRHNKTCLRTQVLSTSRSNDYAGDADANFEWHQPHEFGDDISYNEALERQAFCAAGIYYVQLPVGGEVKYTDEGLVKYAPEMLTALRKAKETSGNILFHCRTGYRTGAYPSALIAVIQGTSVSEIQTKMSRLGYDSSGSMKTMLGAVDNVTYCGDKSSLTGELKMRSGKVVKAFTAPSKCGCTSCQVQSVSSQGGGGSGGSGRRLGGSQMTSPPQPKILRARQLNAAQDVCASPTPAPTARTESSTALSATCLSAGTLGIVTMMMMVLSRVG